MANIFTIKVFGKDVKYIKKGDKFYRIKADGQVAEDAATGLRLSNLKNKDSKLVKKIEAEESKKIVSQFKVPVGVKKVAASTLDKNTKKVLREKQNLESANYSPMKKMKNKKDKALSVIKKDASNTKTDSKPPKPKAKPKSITEMRTKDVKMVTLKDGTKGTIKQRLAEIDKEKGAAKLREKIVKMAKKSKSTKANKGGAMMKKKTKYMAKGGMKKTKYMAKGGAGMKKTKMMSRGGAARRK